ncbi:maleylpyruvate isomerase family mycothiol-dependent enzyme [Nocardia sp. NPDC052566]|uniref:maleylpyruvate isomerase family mycothiol-dependent enzyme n=1 Tax=Nocardia sp. NPDC052566 TaxID=3364330 RepID=UPI0037C5C32E
MTSSATDQMLDTVAKATDRLLDTVRGYTEADVTAPSRLPGWTRGHVLAHLARNADSLVNLLLWARTGIETPQYASMALRDADIEAGAPRPLAEQLTDNEEAADRWLALARAMPAAAWQAPIRTRQGREIPGSEVPWMRLREIEIHHVDLGAGYETSDWPAEFVARLLPETVTMMNAKDGIPAITLRTTDTGFTATLGAATADGTVSGPATAVLAWLLGRSDGADLAGPVPALPAWL